MKRDDFFQEKYFKVDTFGKPRELTISGVRGESFERNGVSEIKPAMAFEETETRWIISMTAFDRLCGQLKSCETDDWRGARIQLHIDRDAQYNGRPCPQFRADVISARSNGQTAPTKAPPAVDDMDIPF